MAKKPKRSGKPVSGGGRVTPKGVRPPDTKRHSGDDESEESTAEQLPAPPTPRNEPGHGGPAANQHAPTRAGHHRGQR